MPYVAIKALETGKSPARPWSPKDTRCQRGRHVDDTYTGRTGVLGGTVAEGSSLGRGGQ